MTPLFAFLDPRLPDRFWSKCIPEPNSGCWIWCAAHSHDGYGNVSVNRKVQLSHRVSYQRLAGPIPPGLTLDHLCRNTLCVNPAHLEVVTNRVNILRGDSAAALFARATHCLRGHEFTPENTIVKVDERNRTQRICRACRRIRNRNGKRRARERRAGRSAA